MPLDDFVKLDAALALLSGIEKLVAVENAPDGVPEFVFTGGSNIYGVWHEDADDHFKYRYRFDGIVETRNTAKEKS
jgi:hypothetical protein